MTDGFLLMFPCFAIQNAEGTGAVVQQADDGSIGLVVLSDDDLLAKYRHKHGFAGQTIRFDSAEQLALYLSSASRSITGVAIDPRETLGVITPTTDFVRAVLDR